MNSENNNSALIIGLIAVIAATLIIGVVLFFKESRKPDQKLSGQTYERVSYDIVGTAASSTGITPNFSGNRKVLISTGLENLHLDVAYTPSSTDSYLLILVEGSNDGGTTYFPMSSKSVGTTDIKMYIDGVSSTAGIPITMPGDSTSVAGTEIKGGIDFDLVADHVRISVLENTTANEGVAYIRATITNKK